MDVLKYTNVGNLCLLNLDCCCLAQDTNNSLEFSEQMVAKYAFMVGMEVIKADCYMEICVFDDAKCILQDGSNSSRSV